MDVKVVKQREFKPSARFDWQFFESERLEELERKEWTARQRLRELMQVRRRVGRTRGGPD
jgi:hypothetical protein